MFDDNEIHDDLVRMDRRDKAALRRYERELWKHPDPRDPNHPDNPDNDEEDMI